MIYFNFNHPTRTTTNTTYYYFHTKNGIYTEMKQTTKPQVFLEKGGLGKPDNLMRCLPKGTFLYETKKGSIHHSSLRPAPWLHTLLTHSYSQRISMLALH